MKHLLAHAVGKVVSRKQGLLKLILPRTLPPTFRHEVAKAINVATGRPSALVVGDRDSESEISPEQAIAFRTPESDVATSVVLVSTSAQFRELKSLEAFRDLLVQGLPGQFNGRAAGLVNLNEICRAVSQLLVENLTIATTDEKTLTEALGRVAGYLGQSYEAFGNAEIEWAEAFWYHLDQLASTLPHALGGDSDRHNLNASVYAAAGLPAPDNPSAGFSEPHDAAKYAATIGERWNRAEALQKAVDDIAFLTRGSEAASHPILQLDWPSFPASRVAFRHPILAVACHGKTGSDVLASLQAWRATSETAFFSRQPEQKIAASLHVRNESNEWVPTGIIPWDTSVFVTPAPPNRVDESGSLYVGEFKAVLSLENQTASPAPQIKLEVRPKTVASVVWRATNMESDRIVVEFELRRRLPKKVGNWKEKPFLIEVAPTYVGPDTVLRDSVEFSILVPHPARPTVLFGETTSKGGRIKLRHHSDTAVQIDPASGLVQDLSEPELSAEVQLESDRSAVSIITIGAASSSVSWLDGETLLRREPLSGVAQAWQFSNVALPEDAVLMADDFAVRVKKPNIESGRFNPIVAAATKEPLTHAKGDFLKLLERDPRADLERWFSEECILRNAGANFRSSLGLAVLATDLGSSQGSLSWNEANAVTSDMQSYFNFKIPESIRESEELAEFWAAFDQLGLSNLAVGDSETSSWPSALDLSQLEKASLQSYLDAYRKLLRLANSSPNSLAAAYPLSIVVFDPSRGAAAAALLSPLHPLRLAWNWSAQQASQKLAASSIYGEVAPAFLRFIDGEKLPVVGPELQRRGQLLSLGLSSGPEGFFSAWSLLASLDIHRAESKKSITLLGRPLPLSAPSGLDCSGITAALRDYLRVYPSTPQLRMALSASSKHERSSDIDEAVLTASSNLLVKEADRLPGGIRVYDSERRTGAPPDANSALRRLQAGTTGRTDSPPAFEWITGHDGVVVDLQFVEDSLVEVDVRRADAAFEFAGCAGPSVPINRFNVWQRDGSSDHVSTASTLLDDSSFSELEGFHSAIASLEIVSAGSQPPLVEGRLKLGNTLLGKRSRWTITGNRNLDPAMLSEQLKESGQGLALWEWRPAFLTREQQRDIALRVSTSHPYTVLARPSEGFLSDLNSTLADCTGYDDANAGKQLLGELGVRGVGLSSLLTMGHTQSVGAVGFFLAFKSLGGWEATRNPNEVRCVIPLDAIYPLIDVLAVGSKATDAQRRADLLLFKADLADPNRPVIHLHPIEIKMRTSGPAAFPSRTDNLLKDATEQLRSTGEKISKMAENYRSEGRHQPLVTSAVATLVEAALALRPITPKSDPHLDLRLLALAACGKLEVVSSNGTILWFRKDGHSKSGAHYEQRNPTERDPGVVLINPLLAFEELSGGNAGEVQKAVSSVVENSFVLNQPSRREKTPKSKSPQQQPDVATPAVAPEGSRPALRQPHAETIPGAQGTGARQTTISNSDEDKASEKAADLRADSQTAQDAASLLEPPVVAASGIDVLVGEGSHQGQWNKIHFRPSNTSLNQLNIGVVGDLGTGKTQFLQSLVYQLASSAASNRGTAPKLFIFDYKQDYTQGSFSDAIGAQILDPAREPIPINFFALPKNSTRVEKVRRAHFFRDVFRRIVSIGAVQANALYESVMQAYEDCAEGHAPTLDDILDVYRSRDGTRDDSVVSQLKLMVDLEIFEKRTSNTTNFEGLFSKNTVLSLRNIGAGQEVVDIIVSLFLDLLYNEYMIKRTKMPFITGSDGVQRRFVDSLVLVDEAHHIMSRGFDVLMSLLLEGREFGMGVILSSQYLSHFKEGGKNWSEALSTWVVHKIRAKARELEEIGFRKDAKAIEQEIGDIERHWAYYRCTDGYNDGVLMKGQPFFSLVPAK